MMRFILPFLLVVAACDPDEKSCESTTDDFENLRLVAHLYADAGGGDVSVRLQHPGGTGQSPGYKRLGEGQTLVLLEGDQTVTPALPANPRTFMLSETGADGCDAGSYTNSLEPGLLDVTVALSDTDGVPRLAHLEAAAVALVSPPSAATVGTPFEITLDRDMPAISGIEVAENWSVELRGDCLVPPAGSDFAAAVDVDGNGSAQSLSVDKKLRIEVSADHVAGDGCAVEATFVSTVTRTSGTWQLVGSYRAAPFTFTLGR